MQPVDPAKINHVVAQMVEARRFSRTKARKRFGYQVKAQSKAVAVSNLWDARGQAYTRFSNGQRIRGLYKKGTRLVAIRHK